MIPNMDSPSLRACNKLLMGNERRDMVRAANFSFAEREGDAERIRERLGYGAAACRHDVDKTPPRNR